MSDGSAESGKGGIAAALKAMISFFTIIRLDVGQTEFESMERRFWLAPVIGLVNGLVAGFIVLLLIECGVSSTVAAVFVLVTPFLFSKFLHFDGLTDFGDGMVVSSGKREDHIRALKDTLVGAGGIGTAITVCLISFACYCGLSIYWLIFPAVMIAETAAKNAQVFAAAWGEPGNGMASRQVGFTNKSSAVRSLILSAVLFILVWLAYIIIAGNLGWHKEGQLVAYFAVLALIISSVSGWIMARNANRVFGFVNGDILGASNEICRAAVLTAFCIIAGLWF